MNEITEKILILGFLGFAVLNMTFGVFEMQLREHKFQEAPSLWLQWLCHKLEMTCGSLMLLSLLMLLADGAWNLILAIGSLF